MAISKEHKKKLFEQYVQDLSDAKNVVVVNQTGVVVEKSGEVRRDVTQSEWKLNVVKKRIFLKALKEAWYQDVDIKDLNGAILALYAHGDEYAPLKSFNKHLKELKKVPDSKSAFELLWGWFDKEWKDSEYVTELANVPSKEELLSKLVWLLNYPVQSFASVVDKISEKVASDAPAEEPKEEKKEEVKEEVKEEKKEEVVEEPKEEKKEETKE